MYPEKRNQGKGTETFFELFHGLSFPEAHAGALNGEMALYLPGLGVTVGGCRRFSRGGGAGETPPDSSGKRIYSYRSASMGLSSEAFQAG